ncbi:MAG: hypothetical protein ISS34_07670 [Candidatus Omnitrophica bacterium]|nr:hypothetical protein [Candidatus Omnitrophota bacterium]
MKKLLVVMLAIAVVISFSPKAEAEGEVGLHLSVTFDRPLEIWSEPEGPFEVKETETLEFMVIAEDEDTERNISLEAGGLPEGATFELGPHPDVFPLRRISGTFVWTPEVGQAQRHPYTVGFVARNSEGETALLEVDITVRPAVIAIELNDTSWILEGIGLGENITNNDGRPAHNITNTGDVVIDVEIGYARHEGCEPDVRPGLDRFMTASGYPEGIDVPIIQPDQYLKVANDLQPGRSRDIPLTYYSPTALSEGIDGMSATYEFRAYPATE